MDHKSFQETIRDHPRPLVVDFWAGWCAPCRAIEPALKRVEKQFEAQVDLLRIDADQAPDLLASLRILGIPTLVAYRNGREIARQVGYQSEADIQSLFQSALSGQASRPISLSPVDRTVRLVAGIGLIGIGLTTSASWLWFLAGALVCFSAVYDRCPIWRAITTRLRSKPEA